MTDLPSLIQIIQTGGSRSRENSLCRPIKLQTLVHFLSRYTCFCFPVCNTHGFSIKGEPSCISTIKYLLSLRQPAAIVFTIVSIIINPIQSHSLRTLAHIFKKILKPIPPLAYLYSATTVMLKMLVIWIQAARAHMLPASIGSGVLTVVRMSMRYRIARKYFALQTTARFRFFASQRIASNRSLCTAHTFAYPIPHATNTNMRVLNYCPPPKFFAYHLTMIPCQ